MSPIRERFPQIRRLDGVAGLRARLAALGCELAVDDSVEPGPAGALAVPLSIRLGDGGTRTIANRWCVLPMEGWDGTPDGRPTELVERRWRRFGASGAALIWGGEAVAVRHDGRANPAQLRIGPDTAAGLARLREALVEEHASRFGTDDDPVVGLQLTHSGRWARPDPDGTPKPRIAVRHPLLDERVGVVDDRTTFSDGELDDLVGTFVDAATLAAAAGFEFVDVKACHGYLVHELLAATHRPGRYGGDLDGRSRFLLTVVDAIRSAVPTLGVGVRLSLFDVPPQGSGPDQHPTFTADDALVVAGRLADLGVSMICGTGGSPYWCPHAQRPAYFPPSDGYEPPEDPLVGVTRHVAAAVALKHHRSDLVVVGSGLTYLQELLPHVAQALVRTGAVDLVGFGRMALSYPELAGDTLAGRPLERARLCRTFSDCTTAPRNGLVSGCWPLDDFYKSRPERAVLTEVKRLAGRRVAAANAPAEERTRPDRPAQPPGGAATTMTPKSAQPAEERTRPDRPAQPPGGAATTMTPKSAPPAEERTRPDRPAQPPGGAATTMTPKSAQPAEERTRRGEK